MNKIRVVFGTLLIMVSALSFLYFQGCNKQSEKVSDNSGTDNTQANAFTESDGDLLSVDYKDFYDALVPKGEWIKVTPDEVGINVKTTSEMDHPMKSMSFTDLFGVNNAYAQDVAAGAFFVWKPAPELSLGISAGAPAVTTTEVTTVTSPAAYVPYTNGSWVNTDNGWYFQSATPEEEIVHHYGRWEHSPSLGWVWLPGKVWSPAWVDWRQDDKYMAWAPIPYNTVVVNDAVPEVVIPAERYVIVEQTHFLDPVYTYRYIAPEPVVIVRNMRRLPGIVVVKNVIVDRGPDVVVVEKVTGKKAFLYPVNRVSAFRDVRFKDNVIYTYSPNLVRVKNKVVFSPAKFSSFNDAKVKFENHRSDWNKHQEEKSKQDFLKQENKVEKHDKNWDKINKDQQKNIERKRKEDHKNPIRKEIKKNDHPTKEHSKEKKDDHRGKDDHSKKGSYDKKTDHGKKGGDDKRDDHGKRGDKKK